MPIKTTTVLSVTQPEVDRVDTQVSGLLAQIEERARRVEELATEVTRLTALIGGMPAPAPPPAVTGGLRVSGAALMTAAGLPVQCRGVEAMWGPTSANNVAKAVGAIKGLGANFVAPLFQRGQATAAHVRACIQECERQQMGCAVNADHVGEGRTWLKRTEIVEVCNAGKAVILQCEVELGSKDSMSAAQWRELAISFVHDLRDAGHTAPIRVGSPSGGRSPSYALQMGKTVLEEDYLHNLMFTWQAYWDLDPSTEWEYATSEGYPRGTPGALACAAALKNSGLCWLVGLDGADDIGPTPYIALAQKLHEYGIAWQWWAMFVGDQYGNGLVSDPLDSYRPRPPFGPEVAGLLRAQSRPVIV